MVLDLEDDRWATLNQAYGDGTVIAAWLRDLTSAGDFSQARQTFWKKFDVYGHLCHQETVYSATYAAIPHLVEYAQRVPLPKQLKYRVDVLEFVGFSAACALIGRPPPQDLANDYHTSLKEARRLIAETMTYTDDENLLQFLCESLAGVTGNYDLFDHIRHLRSEPICQNCGENLICPECSTGEDDE